MSFNKSGCEGQSRSPDDRGSAGASQAPFVGLPGALCATAAEAGFAWGKGIKFVPKPLSHWNDVVTRSARSACLG